MKLQVNKISLTGMKKQCGEVSSLLRALSHPQRLMILGYLTQGEKTVTELQNLCGLSQSQLSQFLVRMKAEGLLNCQRRGRFQYYQIEDPRLLKLIESLHSIFC